MRATSLILLCLLAGPASAGCRLSKADCSLLMQEMEREAEASALDERQFHPRDLSRYERGVTLTRRHLERVDERSFLLPTRIGDEWQRLELCADPSDAASPRCQ